MHLFRVAILVLLSASSAMTADAQTERPVSVEPADPSHGLQSEDVERIEGMLERGEMISTEEREFSRGTLTKTVTATGSVTVMQINIWPFVLLILSVFVAVTVYVRVCHAHWNHRSKTDQ